MIKWFGQRVFKTVPTILTSYTRTTLPTEDPKGNYLLYRGKEEIHSEIELIIY